MTKFTIVDADDWMALYKDGELVCQGHSISLKEALKAATGEYPEWHELTYEAQERLAEVGWFPDALGELDGDYAP